MKIEDTQPIPRLAETQVMKTPEPMLEKRPGSVRELPPLQEGKPAPQKGKLSPKRKKMLWLAGAFLAALFCGFLLAGYFYDQQQAAENEHGHVLQQVDQKEKSLADEEQGLLQKKSQLEQEKADLEGKKQALQSKIDQLAGKNEQLSQEGSSGSVVGQLWDKVTGKEASRQQEIKKNTASGTQSAQDAAAIGDSVEKAQAMLQEVDGKLKNLEQMKSQAGQMKAQAESAYQQNAGTIQQIFHYAADGVQLVGRMLTQ